ncbi:uncharacterized protein [Lolium perenne]|uniref:uncharacterized protein n=1 Tax=Lolium perenne TaxID=4522 RepID=UPI003A998899
MDHRARHGCSIGEQRWGNPRPSSSIRGQWQQASTVKRGRLDSAPGRFDWRAASREESRSSAAVVQAREVGRATGLAPQTVPELILSGPSRESTTSHCILRTTFKIPTLNLIHGALYQDAASNTKPSRGDKVHPCATAPPHSAAPPLHRQLSSKPLGGGADPSRLSEDIVCCMRNIFISLSDSRREASRSRTNTNPSSLESQRSVPSPSGISAFWSLAEPSAISSWVQSPQVDLNQNNSLLASETVFDPYKAREKLSWADMGTYGAASEVSWMSAGKKQLDYAAESLRKFRLLIEQLAEVNPVHLNDDARLAFWINLYNALLMHAYLAYGVPRSDMKLFSLMQKAAYTIGGNSFSAAFIEYVIMKMKPPNHRPQMALLLALQKIKAPEEHKKFCISAPEPLLTFALSCGMYSSPLPLLRASDLLSRCCEPVAGSSPDHFPAAMLFPW